MIAEVAPTPIASFCDKKERFFSAAELARIDAARIPQHIAIIPDGNRRWAKKRVSNIQKGHQEGADTLMNIVKAAKELGVKALTFYSFSTENWNRSPEEVFALMMLFTDYLTEQREEMANSGIKLETIGELSSLPSFLRATVEETKRATAHCNRISLVLALNYGSRNEICRAFQFMAEDLEKGALKKENIDESTISRYLDTRAWKDPDLLIRTSGELRVSNFLLWQISYAEIHVSPVLWPDFTPSHLIDAIVDFQSRERRWGGA